MRHTFSVGGSWIKIGLAAALALTLAAASETRAADPAVKVASAAGADAQAKEPPLIPRKILFGNPTRATARLSPNGKWLSYMTSADGKLNVFVAPVDDLSKAKQVTFDKQRDILGYFWAYTGKHILYTQDKAGDENFHVYATDVETGKTIDLTPLEKVRAQIEEVSEKFPNEILVGLNDRNPQLHDIWRVNIETGERKLVLENPGVLGYVTDDDFKIRFAQNFTPDGGFVMLEAPETGAEDPANWPGKWKEFLKVGSDDATTTGAAGFDKTGQILYLQDSRGRDTGALFTLDLKTGEKKLVAEDPRTDVGGIITHPTEKNIQAVSFTYAKTEWKILDEAIRADFDYLKTVEDGEFIVTSRTLDDTKWTVAYVLDDGPVKFYLYDRTAKKARHLFNSRDDLDAYPLVKMHDRVIKSRDGLDLVCYLSLPPGSDPDGDGVPNQPLPMVLNVHGGPWVRDTWGYDGDHQWLANRGYAVMNVNYRGSTGFGKKFTNIANGEWAAKMHDDLIDVVNWAVDKKIATRDKVAIMGGSYGGYATLVGVTFTPEVFACGVDSFGPSSLVTLMQNVPPYWIPAMPRLKLQIGDIDTEEGKKFLLSRSPLTLVDKIQKPLLISQGANDARVKQIEADQIVEAMEAKHIPVTYVLYPDEGHGFVGEQNRKSFNAVTEAFLAPILGGRFEPIGEDFEGASLYVPAGAENVPGLAAALPADRRQAPPKPPTAEDSPKAAPGGG